MYEKLHCRTIGQSTKKNRIVDQKPVFMYHSLYFIIIRIPLKTFIQFVGGIVGLIGGLRIYNKWQNGDQDVNKEILGWGGACLFLTIVPTFVGSFFGLS